MILSLKETCRVITMVNMFSFDPVLDLILDRINSKLKRKSWTRSRGRLSCSISRFSWILSWRNLSFKIKHDQRYLEKITMLLFLLACQPEKEQEDTQEDTALELDDTAVDDTGEPIEDTDTQDTQDTDETDTQDTQDTQEEPACPDGVTCPTSFRIITLLQSTSTTSEFDSYSCAPSTDESGPENIYRIILAEEGFIALDLETVGSGVDVDVHLWKNSIRTPVLTADTGRLEDFYRLVNIG